MKFVLFGVLALTLLAGPAVAQNGKKPVMENVFFNVVWGSAMGATIGVAIAIIGSEDKSSPSNLRSNSFTGATTGGLIGLGAGLWLIYQGIIFEPGSAIIASSDSPNPTPSPALAYAEPPFQLVTAADNPLKITGFKARVFGLKF